MTLPEGFAARPFAHRGLHGALGNGASAGPENSMGAIRAAVAGGWGIEIDVQPSAEGVAMVFHDDDLGRLTDADGRIRERPVLALRGLRLADGSSIPTLREVLDEVAGRVPLLIEIKDQDGAMGPGVGRLEQAVAAELEGYGGPVGVMSFNPHSVAALADLAPDVPRGLTTCSWDAAEWPHVPGDRRDALREMPVPDHASFVSHDRRDLASDFVARAGVPVFCWTVRSAEQERAARAHAAQVTFERYLPA